MPRRATEATANLDVDDVEWLDLLDPYPADAMPDAPEDLILEHAA